MKIKLILSSLIVAGVLFTTQATATDYKIDTGHTFVTFKVSHLGYSFTHGRFNDFEGNFSHDSSNPGASKVNVVIDAKSVDTNHADRDKDLRSDNFLDVRKHPTITFESTAYMAGSDSDTLKGNLTIFGITKAVAIKVNHIGEGKDPWGGYRSGFRGNITLNSADFGMPDWLGDLEIELNVEGIRI
jgi:polyisoprenoid-binding protein YceI